MRLRRVAAAILGVALALAAAVGVVAFLSARDRSTFSAEQGPGQAFADQGRAHVRPGQERGFRYDSQPPTSGPHVAELPRHDRTRLGTDQLLEALEVGDVVIVYPSRRQEPALGAAARALAGPFSPALAAAGQAMILDFQPGARLVAAAWTHLQPLRGPDDPRLSEFASAWLGRGAAG